MKDIYTIWLYPLHRKFCKQVYVISKLLTFLDMI